MYGEGSREKGNLFQGEPFRCFFFQEATVIIIIEGTTTIRTEDRMIHNLHLEQESF